jgi:hypothetical protein
MRIILILASLIISGSCVYAQKDNCKVLLPEIAGSYSGACKKGLAHGKGVAQGIDYYEGHFYKGNPNGKGKYIWANGIIYEGEWNNGIRDGAGKMIYPDSVISGYWKENKYIGKKFIPPYSIQRSLGVSRSTLIKSIGSLDGVRIKILQGGSDNTNIQELSFVYSSGDEYRMGNIYGIQNTVFPLDVKVRYTTWNQLHTARFNVTFEFRINDPGTWDVTITN